MGLQSLCTPAGTHKDATQLVQHPVGGGIQPLHVLLGTAHHLAASLWAGSK